MKSTQNHIKDTISTNKPSKSPTNTESSRQIGAIYGDTLLYISPKHSKVSKIQTNPAYRMPFCHQSAFVKTSLLKQHHFDTSFQICADNDFFTTIYKNGVRFYHIEKIVSIYDAHGLSSKPSLTFFKEELRIISKLNKLYALPFICKYAIMVAKFSLKSILPKALAYKIQSVYNAK